MKKFITVLMMILLFTGCAGSNGGNNVNKAAEPLKLNGISRPNGDLSEITLQETTQLNEEEVAEVNRAMRAYSPTSGTPLINNAKEFYYYGQLDSYAKDIYDVLAILVEDPEDPDNIVVYSSDLDPNSQQFAEELRLAYYALLYDHPELFWLYNDIKASIMFGVPNKQSEGYYDIYFYFEEPYTDFRSDVEKFNQATAEFLSDIDLNGSESDIALAIHDKLISTVTYDMEVLNNGVSTDLAHTAYGALVENSEGMARTAVCDGYSLAYEYLLQQAGLKAAVIIGNAGDDADSAGGHAWNIVNIDGKWHEVDSCWDDFGTLEDQLQDHQDADIYPYYMEALADADYRKQIEHYLYLVSTSLISNYTPGDEYIYYSKDGKYMYSLLGEGVHIRASEIADWVPLNEMVALAPLAE